VFGLLGALMAYFIIPVQFSRKLALLVTDKAAYTLIVYYYKTHCGPVSLDIEGHANAYRQESGQEIWAGFDAVTQPRGPVVGSPTWCRCISVLWLKTG
jgi:hypothetical protein